MARNGPPPEIVRNRTTRIDPAECTESIAPASLGFFRREVFILVDGTPHRMYDNKFGGGLGNPRGFPIVKYRTRHAGSGRLVAPNRKTRSVMLRPFIVSYKYKCPGDKKPGAIKQYRIYADSLDDARRIVAQHANYPDVEVLSIKPA